MNYLPFLIFLIAFFLSLTFTFLCIQIAKKFNIVDKPNGRKIHNRSVPYLGGLAIYFSFIVTILIVLNFLPLVQLRNNIQVFLISGAFILVFGLYDDLKGSNPIFKLIVQFIVSLIVISSGFTINRIINPFGGNINLSLWTSYVFTVFWIVGIITVINLFDGLDGLAAGGISISLIFLYLIANVVANFYIAIISIILLGALLGFFIFNFPPAKIFMGDAGSMFLGLMIALLGIIGNRRTEEAIPLVIPIILLLFPVIDTILAIFRRIKKRKNIFHADNEHLHHRLLNLNLGYKITLFLIYSVNVYLGVIAFLFLIFSRNYLIILFPIVLISLLAGLEILHIFEKRKRNQKEKF